MEKNNALVGNTVTFKTPSKFDVTIREQNGDDDEVISKMKHAMKGEQVNIMVTNLVLNCSLTGGRVTLDQVKKWKNKDKYYVLFKSRIFSLGDEITYKHTCQNEACGKETTYEEQLLPYDRDFSKPDDESDNKFKYQITPYPNGIDTEVEFELTSGKKLKYQYLNWESERIMLEMDRNEISKNTDITIRKLEWLNEGKWQKIENYRLFSAKEMAEIRKHIKYNDKPFEAISETTCPFCGNIDHITLIAQPDFFFPGEI